MVRFLEIGFAIFEEFHVAVELVDDETLEAGPVFGLQHRKGADDGGNHAAAVDIAHEEGRNIDGLGKAHVGKIAIAQVDFGGASRTFHDDEVGLLGELPEAFDNGGHELLAVLEKIARRHGGGALALNDDLGAGGGFGFQQHRVHVNGCGLPGGAGLQGLGPADLAAIAGDGGIVRHVLRLEGHHFQSAPGEGAAEAGGHQGFAHVGAGAHEHEGAGLHGASHMTWA